ncbi:hypothetical protein IAQ61_006725 [Plenodomus lingam]|uniref:uncharacterized protein n=1 Tax=Leptosphaeria maculans TaxID=5022 RepID=UPI00332D8C62|nr:hypothetical protein IAQ61_006725 [Plenodomus lingam]
MQSSFILPPPPPSIGLPASFSHEHTRGHHYNHVLAPRSARIFDSNNLLSAIEGPLCSPSHTSFDRPSVGPV